MTVAADRKWYHMLTSIFHQTHYTMMPPGGYNVQTAVASSGAQSHNQDLGYAVERKDNQVVMNAQHVIVDKVFTAAAHRKQDLIVRYAANFRAIFFGQSVIMQTLHSKQKVGQSWSYGY